MTRYKKSIIWQGKRRSITLTPSDHALLLRRFDVRNAKRSGFDYVIDVSCPLCKKFLDQIRGCSPKCPFDKFAIYLPYHGKTGGCRELWNRQEHDIEPAITMARLVTWHQEDHEQAKLELKSIRDWFKSFRRVET